MNLNVSWWWMDELILWQELKLCNDTWHRLDKRKSKTKKKNKNDRTTFYSLCNYCMTYNGAYFPFWQHTLQPSFVFMSLPLGMHENKTITTLKPG